MATRLNKLDKTIVEAVPKSIRVDTIIDLHKGSGVLSVPYFPFGCPERLGSSRHVDTLCPSCFDTWAAGGYRAGAVRDFVYNLDLLDKLEDRNW